MDSNISSQIVQVAFHFLYLDFHFQVKTFGIVFELQINDDYALNADKLNADKLNAIKCR